MNMFLKGLHNFPHIVERIIDKSPTDYYDLKGKTIAIIKNQQLLHAIKNSSNLTPFRQNFQQQPAYTLRPSNYNSSNAPHHMNNVPVPMDLSRGCAPPNHGWPRNDSHQTRGNTTQLKQNQQQSRGNAAQLEQGQNPMPHIQKCYNCNKPRHFARECRKPKQERAHQAYVQDYMDQEEDLLRVQEEIHPSNLLDNAFRAFDTLPLEQKDAMIA